MITCLNFTILEFHAHEAGKHIRDAICGTAFIFDILTITPIIMKSKNLI